eukprot:CAMPEP_0183712944 /NCGR_PEP_ID=MMETSP0737-20130205/7972_1 /TAXON_ID=385413 /ORGANISM="Thalassiosira miniscula, Strain CCMP1093" /LENGTH=367 /DNA_ID=CAMNT_0025941683 /DNA_START=108 /DNA_END=1208 /DNA_ORIENTATION=+
MVRPICDLIYALAYYFTAIWGLLSGKYTLNRAGYLLSKSMIWHGLILPALSILPLFIKFIQTLRQAYDTGKRWPYLGNAFKYFTAGLVTLYGMTHASVERSTWWLGCFIAATIYQIAWDSFVDWELMVFVPRSVSSSTLRKPNPRSWRIVNFCRRIRDMFPYIRLRPKRLFDDDSYYRKALFINAALRCCWMYGFIPAYRVSIADGSTQVTFVDKAHGWSFVLLATLEIFRRSIWGIIKVELETIKLMGSEGGENDLDNAGTADEYLREGMWKVPLEALNPAKESTQNWRCRPNKGGRMSSHENDTSVVWLDEETKQYSKLEQTEHTETLASTASEVAPEKRRHRWLCMSVSSRFLRWLFIAELMVW